MSERAVERIETTIDTVAATLFAAAMAFAVATLFRGALPVSQWVAIAAVALIIGYAGCLGVLRQIQPANQDLSLPIFAPPPIETVQVDELVLADADRLRPASTPPTESDEPLVLTDADRLHPASTPPTDSDESLVLDDILTEIDPKSRVVRLFDPATMLTPGQLKARIEEHLDEGSSPTAAADASQALSEALAQLRRSLA